jgi:hypothetical protein
MTYWRDIDRIASTDCGSIELKEGVTLAEYPQQEKGQRDGVEIHIGAETPKHSHLQPVYKVWFKYPI